MPDELKLNRPWLIAVWPGMGHVALSAGYYLMAKMGMHLVAEFSARDLFDVEHVEVKNGLIRTGRAPRSRFFVWNDPTGKRDLLVFVGEAQPPSRKHAFCQKLMEFAQQLGVERVFTFAAMATEMQLEAESRVFGAATDEVSLAELKRLELVILEDGHIGGLNGLLLGVAEEAGLPGTCLLGEMPHILAQLPFPKASLAVLHVFQTIAGIEIDFTELTEQARDMEEKLGELIARVESLPGQQDAGEDEAVALEPDDDETLEPGADQHIEELFAEAKHDRSKAYELKNELDRLGLYKRYEDRFLDLFKKAE